jgi:hypothetical protein
MPWSCCPNRASRSEQEKEVTMRRKAEMIRVLGALEV